MPRSLAHGKRPLAHTVRTASAPRPRAWPEGTPAANSRCTLAERLSTAWLVLVALLALPAVAVMRVGQWLRDVEVLLG